MVKYAFLSFSEIKILIKQVELCLDFLVMLSKGKIEKMITIMKKITGNEHEVDSAN